MGHLNHKREEHPEKEEIYISLCLIHELDFRVDDVQMVMETTDKSLSELLYKCHPHISFKNVAWVRWKELSPLSLPSPGWRLSRTQVSPSQYQNTVGRNIL